MKYYLNHRQIAERLNIPNKELIIVLDETCCLNSDYTKLISSESFKKGEENG
jgi:hypothetical protein